MYRLPLFPVNGKILSFRGRATFNPCPCDMNSQLFLVYKIEGKKFDSFPHAVPNAYILNANFFRSCHA